MRSVPGDSSGWRSVDRDAAGVAHFLEAATQILGSIKRKSIDMLRLQPGASVLDVGCGLGSDAVAMAERVGAAGRVVGIDASQELIAKAVERTQAMDLRPEFRVGNAALSILPTTRSMPVARTGCCSTYTIQHRLSAKWCGSRSRADA
jgi:SAM-dependent methyltransferase